jgi:hypothetical protein
MLIFQMLAFMAGPTLDTGQQIAYLQLFLLPYLLQVLCQALYPTDPVLRKITYDVFLQGRSWRCPLWGRRSDHPIPKHHRRQKKPSVRFLVERAQRQTLDLPCPDSGHSPQGWLLRRVLPPLLAAEGALPIPSSEGAVEHCCLDLHSPFGHNQWNIDRPIRLGFISDRH